MTEPTTTAARPQSRVLVVDDNGMNRLLLGQHVTQLGHQPLGVENGRKALDLLQGERFDLVLLDVMMPEMDGHAVLHHIKGTAELREIPVIMISGLDEIETAARCIEAGAEDYLVRPFDPVLLRARVTATLEKKQLRDLEKQYLEELLRLKQELAERNSALEEANRKLEQAAFTDVLTGLPNRRFALEHLMHFWATSGRYGHPLSCLLLDVDHFKKINDTWGHDRGDLVLAQLAGVLRETLRVSDIVCRLGGEEFIVLCPLTDLSDAQRCGERLRAAIEAFAFRGAGFEQRVTVSIGVATRTLAMDHPDELLKAADRAVYAAKESGRNRVECARLPVSAIRLPPAPASE
ncbi:MAG: diguanylate cyclase [Planctomycetia bacterium]|nr:diguanylate cyclase [Planctomycetia bacterium]